MRIRFAFILTITSILLAACNFTLAADVTPPPGYVPPTPAATMGPLYPANPPDIRNGAAIYAEKCAPCHGETGLGDGPQGVDLPVSVAALGLPATANKATPSAWYAVVTQGNIERFMPPFSSLNDQERWDVISYALTLHTTADEIEKGKSIFEAGCAGCAAQFEDRERMAGLSANQIVEIIKNGEGDIPAFGSGLSDEDAYAVAAYIRTLSFAPVQTAQVSASATPASDSAPATSAATQAGTPPAEETPVEGTPQAALNAVEAPTEPPVLEGIGTVSGKIDNQTGKALPSDLIVTLHVYDHSTDPASGPQEILTLEGNVEADGVYRFEDVEIPENRIFVAEVVLNDTTYRSDFAVVEAGATGLTVPDLAIYATTDDFSALTVDALQIFFLYDDPDSVQVFAVYSIMNSSDKTIAVKLNDTSELPFVKFPEGAESLGYETTPDTAPFVTTLDGVAMPPSETPYGLVVLSSMPRANKLEFSQAVDLPVANIVIFLPEGVTAKGGALTEGGIQDLQGASYQIYHSSPLVAGESVDFSVSGKPASGAGTTSLTQNQTLLIGVGALGFVLILAGVWMYMRDRNPVEETEEEKDEFEDTDSVLDAIIALDDLHRAGKLGDDAYHRRRDELKAKLKDEK